MTIKTKAAKPAPGRNEDGLLPGGLLRADDVAKSVGARRTDAAMRHLAHCIALACLDRCTAAPLVVVRRWMPEAQVERIAAKARLSFAASLVDEFGPHELPTSLGSAERQDIHALARFAGVTEPASTVRAFGTEMALACAAAWLNAVKVGEDADIPRHHWDAVVDELSAVVMETFDVEHGAEAGAPNVSWLNRQAEMILWSDPNVGAGDAPESAYWKWVSLCAARLSELAPGTDREAAYASAERAAAHAAKGTEPWLRSLEPSEAANRWMALKIHERGETH